MKVRDVVRMAALTAEVRQLRIAVEQLARTQTEAQALGVALSAQSAELSPTTEPLAAAATGNQAEATEIKINDARVRVSKSYGETPTN
jgi:hypothetical protein